MNILITGATGFIGHHLLQKAITRLSADNIALLTSREIPGYNCVLHNGYTYDKEVFCRSNFKYIDAVIHMGAFVPREKADRNAGHSNYTTISNTVYLLEHLPNIPGKFIYLSSSDVYGEDDGYGVYKEGRPDIVESDNPNPTSAYARAKYLCEQIILEWAHANNVICQILRPTYVYGNGDFSVRIIPIMVKQAISGKDLILFGPPSMIRNYLYVDDCCELILNSLDMSDEVGPISLVAPHNTTIKNLARTIVRIANNGITCHVRDNVEPKGVDMGYNSERSRRLMEISGGRFTPLEKGLRKEFLYLRDKLNKL